MNAEPPKAILPPLNEGSDFSHVTFGRLDELAVHSFAGISGKVFLKEALGLTGMEVSVNVMEPGNGMPFNHRHRLNEELYVFLGGHGQFMVGDAIFDVRPGSCVRVAPDGVRCWRNTGAEPLFFLCIQSPMDGMKVRQRDDGIAAGRPHWNTKQQEEGRP